MPYDIGGGTGGDAGGGLGVDDNNQINWTDIITKQRKHQAQQNALNEARKKFQQTYLALQWKNRAGYTDYLDRQRNSSSRGGTSGYDKLLGYARNAKTGMSQYDQAYGRKVLPYMGSGFAPNPRQGSFGNTGFGVSGAEKNELGELNKDVLARTKALSDLSGELRDLIASLGPLPELEVPDVPEVPELLIGGWGGGGWGGGGFGSQTDWWANLVNWQTRV